MGVVVNGGNGLMNGLVTGHTEKRLITRWIEPRREEDGGTRGMRGCSDMRRFSNGGGDRDARDPRGGETRLSRDTGVGCSDMRRSFEAGWNGDIIDPGSVKLPVPFLRRRGDESGGVVTRDCRELTARRKSARDISSRAGCIGRCVRRGFSSARNGSLIVLDLRLFCSGWLIRAAASWKVEGLRVE